MTNHGLKKTVIYEISLGISYRTSKVTRSSHTFTKETQALFYSLERFYLQHKSPSLSDFFYTLLYELVCRSVKMSYECLHSSLSNVAKNSSSVFSFAFI